MLKGADWGTLFTKILGWVGTVLYGLVSLILIVAGANQFAKIAQNLPGASGSMSGGFIAGLCMIIVMFAPFIVYYLYQILALKQKAE
jgi:hypothetical protein